MASIIDSKNGHSSASTTRWFHWFQGSALEPTALQALPAESLNIPDFTALRSEAEPRKQCVPRQSQGTRIVTGCVHREASKNAVSPELRDYHTRAVALFALSILLFSSSSIVRASELSDAEIANSIRKLFSDRCYTCHGPDDQARATEMRFDRDGVSSFKTGSGKLVAEPGNLKESEIWDRVHSSDPETVMPPPSSKIDLSDQQKELIKTWIERGAKYKAKHWSFEPLPAKVSIPSSSVGHEQDAYRNPIDVFVNEKLQLSSLRMQPTADRATLARRASLALTGRLPEVDQVQRLMSSHNGDAYSSYVDCLLASPQFGERVATHWLDLSRYADTHGYQTDRYRDVWPYRDWVVSAINQDMPYDQFITWQLAGDMLPNATDEQRLATAFNRLHRQTEEGGSTEEEFRVEYMTDRVNTLGTAIMGVTFQCSRCHDHKYDPLTQKEYFRLCDMFDNIEESGLTSYWTDSMPGPTLLLLDPSQKQQVATLEKAMTSVHQAYDEELLRLSKSDTVEKWYSSLSGWPQPDDQWLSAEFAFEKPEVEPATQFVNRIHADKPGNCEGTIQWQRDGKHSAVLLDGDNALVFPKSGVFSRSQEFTICFELKVPKFFDRAVVLHRSKSWTDAGSRGYQLLIEDGHFNFDIVHYWPSSAIRIRCLEKVSLNKWQKIALVYGGTNRAEDTFLYIDGQRAACEIVRNSLHKDILYERVDVALSIGARNRDRGLPGGLVDELQVYDAALTAIEIAGLATDEAYVTWSELTRLQQSLWREHYAQRIDPQCKYHKESFQHYFKSLTEIVQPAREMMVMNETAKNHPTRFLNRGSYETPGEIVEPGVHQALLSEAEAMPRNRLELAQWLSSDHHPLTARVAVNHIWYQMFGRGLVVTTEDFGVQGQSPTHPALLDYLSREFIRVGWSRKAMVRMIATSRVFMQSSQVDADTRNVDGDGAMLSHYPAQRLTAEQIRDGALQVGGLLSERLGGAPVYPYQPAGLWEEKSGLKYPQSKNEGLYRRSLYTIWKRTSPPPSMMIFDSAGREVCSARREVTVTSLQALVLMNDPQFVEASRAIAIDALGIKSSSQFSHVQFEIPSIERALKSVVRKLTSLECPDALLERLISGFEEQVTIFQAQPEQITKLLNVGQWRGIETQDIDLQSKLAALTLVVNSILNTDGFTVMR